MQPIPVGQLAVWVHSPEKEPLARVLLIHGLSEHSARHLNTVNALTKMGYEVVRFDLRGAGVSGGARQHIETFDDYIQDVTQVYTWICREKSQIPLFVLGHSLGGLIAIYFTANYNRALSGLLLSAPAFKVGEGISPLKIALGKFASRFLPKLKMPKSIGEPVSRDQSVVEEYEKDPLNCQFNTVKQGVEILNAMDHLLGVAKKITCPVMIVHGTSDRIINPEGSFELIRTFSSKDKVLQYLPLGYHEPHNDLCKEEYFSLLEIWLSKHLKKRH